MDCEEAWRQGKRINISAEEWDTMVAEYDAEHGAGAFKAFRERVKAAEKEMIEENKAEKKALRERKAVQQS